MHRAPHLHAHDLTLRTTRTILATFAFGGVLVSTRGIRRRRHAEDDALASLIIASKKTANEELALAA